MTFHLFSFRSQDKKYGFGGKDKMKSKLSDQKYVAWSLSLPLSHLPL